MPKAPEFRNQGPTLSADAITSRLRDMILDGSFPVGLQLKQEALAERFGVSRFPVREALKKLEAEGLVHHTPFAGSVVASQSILDLIQTLDIRIGLESRALTLAIPQMRAADIRAVEAIMKRYDTSDSPREWAELNIEFHMRLYAPCKRPRLLKMIEEIMRSIDVHLRAYQSTTLGRKLPQTDHREILAACVKRDVRRATDLLQWHIERTQTALREADSRESGMRASWR